MKILFIHQAFPGQFKFLAPALASDPSNEVIALTMQPNVPPVWNGVRIVRYELKRGSTQGVHPWVVDFETKTIRAEATFLAALELRKSGFTPNVIVAHPGWGESLFLKEVWPDAKLGIYCEFYYRAQGADVNFDPEFPAAEVGEACRLRLKNLNNLLHFETADAGISPTHWQASTFPEAARKKITVIHDGIDCDSVVPDRNVELTLNGNLRLTCSDEIITFVNRNLEPYRGYHIFMRALPELLRRRPNARVLIVGADQTSYGSKPPPGTTWKKIYLDEVKTQISASDMQRVHFLGHVEYKHFVPLLQLSTVHVYLTYPFVLSWSLLEAMSAGCAIVASNTQPVREAIKHDVTGRLVDFFDGAGLVKEVCSLLDDPTARQRLGNAARAFAKEHYDLKSICLPQQLAWVKSLTSKTDA
jgi:glycosyltransferase involved in cell wall biosynthesis